MALAFFSLFAFAQPPAAGLSAPAAQLVLPWSAVLLLLLPLLSFIIFLVFRNRRLRRRLRTAERQVEELEVTATTMDAVPLSILWFYPDGRIARVNATALAVLGFSREQMLSMRMEALDPELSISGIRSLVQTLEREQSITVTGRLTDKNGHAFPVEQKLLLVESGNDRQLVSINRDISSFILENRRKQEQEDALRRARDEAQAAARMKSEFIANMNHEIRTPMNAILGYAEMLSAADLKEREHRFVQTILKSGATLIGLLNDIMELSKLESGRLKINRAPISLKSLIDEVHDLFVDQLLAKKIEFISSVDPKLPEVFLLDAMHCRQILVNLVSNGVKFTRFGLIRLTVSGTVSGDNLYELRFEVADTGIGIPLEKQQEIFDLFEPRKSGATMGGGKRLGLTLCSRLAITMGGSMSLTSAPGRGSSFVLRLPAEVATRSHAAELPGTYRKRRSSAPTDREPVLLVVDDMAMISDIIRDYFARQPVEVVVAATSEEGLELARNRLPDLILMDLNLAGIDGREAARELKKSAATRDIPVVVMTGRSLDPADYRPDFEDLLAKPFHLDDLERIVNRYLQIPGREGRVQAGEGAGSVKENELPELTCWNRELDDLLHTALKSGSLNDALDLGLRMRQMGTAQNCEALTILGRRLEEDAVALDIIGVEQMLELLRGTDKKNNAGTA